MSFLGRSHGCSCAFFSRVVTLKGQRGKSVFLTTASCPFNTLNKIIPKQQLVLRLLQLCITPTCAPLNEVNKEGTKRKKNQRADETVDYVNPLTITVDRSNGLKLGLIAYNNEGEDFMRIRLPAIETNT
eukprot:5704148-Amphidinium_carterae.1